MNNFRTLELAEQFYSKHSNLKFGRRHLQDQFDRAILSIVLNLAEGSAKPTPKDRRKFYRIALGSLREVQALLKITGNVVPFQDSDSLGASLYCLCRSLA